MNGLSASELADLVGVTAAEGGRRGGPHHLGSQGRRRPVPGDDVQKVRLATACERAGLPMEGIAAAIRAGRLSFAFLEAAPYRRGPVRASGADQRTVMELASQLATAFLPLVDRALMGICRRQQEVVWTEDLVEDIETELEAAGVLTRPQRVPAMSFLDLVGYTRLTEERSDQAAAELA